MKNNVPRAYYGAANGYSGFRSYFDEIFEPKNFERIFIIKGGPGTGKSTLMKRLSRDFSAMGYDYDEIYCSSDPKSLDGVIISGRVAVIDGTAPHEMDTRLPGAVDEIINLGEGWNEEMLKSERQKIQKINYNKKENYISAYKYLSLSGNINDYITEILEKSFDIENAKSKISDLLKNYKKHSNKPKKLLFSAFGKLGYTRRDFTPFKCGNIYNVRGKFGEENIFMDELFTSASNDYSLIRFPSPLSDDITEALYFEDEKSLFITNFNEGEEINASEYLIESCKDELEFLKNIKDSFLSKSQNAFLNASDAHFSLEEIYIKAMDFQKNEAVYSNLKEKLSKILS